MAKTKEVIVLEFYANLAVHMGKILEDMATGAFQGHNDEKGLDAW